MAGSTSLPGQFPSTPRCLPTLRGRGEMWLVSTQSSLPALRLLLLLLLRLLLLLLLLLYLLLLLPFLLPCSLSFLFCVLLLFLPLLLLFRSLVRKMSWGYYIGDIFCIIIIAFKGAIRDFLQSPHCVANHLQHIRSSGPGTIVCKSRATHRALICYHVQLEWYFSTLYYCRDIPFWPETLHV